MRSRAGTRQVTLAPSQVVAVMSLARSHDEMLKDARQDLFRAETRLRVAHGWKWPVRLGCIALGAAGLAAVQNEAVLASGADFLGIAAAGILGAGNMALLGVLALCGAGYGMFHLMRRALRGPGPERQARKLMEQFAQKDGVAAYVFAGQDTPEAEAASIGALTRTEIKDFRKRRLTASHRTLQSSLQSLLNRQTDGGLLQILH